MATRHQTTLRTSLVKDLSLLVVVAAAAVLGTMTFTARKAVRALSASLTETTLSVTTKELESFFAPVERELRLAAAIGRDIGFDVDEPNGVTDTFVPFLEQTPQVDSMLLANDQGQEWMLLREDDGWLSRRTDPSSLGTSSRLTRRLSDGTETVETAELGYDPRTRPWFTGAIEQLKTARARGVDEDDAQLVSWTQPYTFFTTKEPGITASMALEDPSGVRWVVALDVLIKSISDFTMSVDLGEHGRLVVVSEPGLVVGLPRDPRFRDEDAQQQALLQPPEQLQLQVVSDAATAFNANGREPDVQGPVRFRSGDEVWWAEVRQHQLGADGELWIAVILSEAELLGTLPQARVMLSALLFAVFALAIWRVRAIARRFSAPVEELVAQSERIGRLELDQPTEIETNGVHEMRVLADALEHTRASLLSLTKLERDLQVARSIQQGTFPKLLPDIPGFSLGAWSEPAEETGGDSYDVIGFNSNGKAGGSVVLGEPRADHAILMLADATGHGIGPALSATQVRSMLRMAVRMGARLDEIMRNMNEQLGADLGDGRFVTAWLGRLDGASGRLAWLSAGQAPLLHYRAADDAFDVIPAGAPPLGILDVLDAEQEPPRVLAPGDVFAVLSDGIYEAMDASDRQFGVEGVQRTIRATRNEDADTILERIRAEVVTFTRGAPPADDRTGIVVKRR